MDKAKNKVIIAMSGGVDSSVAAALLKRQGYFAIGVFMKFWLDRRSFSEGGKEYNRCCSAESEKMARLVAKQIGIPFYVLNAQKEFKKHVVDYFLREYKKGFTPNPCVVCNKEIKFGFLIKKALSLGADFVATGHYAINKNGKLFASKDKNKDQTYFLWQLNQKQVRHILFPVGNYTKPQVRALAKKFKLPSAESPESQEICFIPALTGRGRGNATNDFLKRHLRQKSGRIINKQGKILGKHQGLWFYTIGQRRGLEIPQGPWYVADKNTRENTLIVSKNKNDLFKKELIAKNVNWISPQKLAISAEVKIRYKSKLAKARILKLGKNKAKIIFAKTQVAITPGQSAVFYKGSQLLGGGVIE